MADPNDTNAFAGGEASGDEAINLQQRLMRHMKEAAETPLRAAPYEPEHTTSIWDVQAFDLAFEELSRRTDAYREGWARIDQELATASLSSQSVPSMPVVTPSSFAETGAAALRLLSGFTVRLEDLIKGWSQQPHESGISSLSLAGARSQSKSVPRIEDASTVPSPPTSAIVAAEWLPERSCLMLDWAKSAETGLLKASATVEAFLDRAGQRSRLPASFRRFPDGSVSIDIVTIELPQPESDVLAGAEVEVAWLSDEEGMTQRLVVVFHLREL